MTKKAKNREYWKKRFELLEESSNKQGREYCQEVEKEFRKAQATIESDIARWYQRFADNNGISLPKARQLLSAGEMKELKWTVEEYIKRGKENAITQEWMQELENASVRVHINRLESIKLQIQHQMEVAYGNLHDGLDNLLTDMYANTYYQTAYEIQKGLGVGKSLAKLDNSKIKNVLSKPWTADAKTFSNRIWSNKDKLINTVYTNLTQSIIRGDDPNKAIGNITKVMETSRKQAGRLVMTESAFISSAAQKGCFQKLDVEKYEIIATLDTHTSDICRDLDGVVFDMKDYEVGVTAPPFHVYCRTSTCPFFDDEFTIDEMRAYRAADGSTQYVNDMTYKEWSKNYLLEAENQKSKPNQDTVIDKKYINSKEYHDIFKRLTENQEVNETIYRCSKEMLRHRSGTLFEDMYFIDINTGKVIASSKDINIERTVGYNKEIKKALKEYDMTQVIAIHNHPSGMPPSAGDFNSAMKNGYSKCFTIGHDGSIIEYSKGNKLINKLSYEQRLALERIRNDEYDAQIATLNVLTARAGIYYKEIAYGKRK
ncbi:MAG TPA: minor capsid protein [Lachnospiraceae bacterium]|nr:minor capsid protein [Lachnospiraceae bacterium]